MARPEGPAKRPAGVGRRLSEGLGLAACRARCGRAVTNGPEAPTAAMLVYLKRWSVMPENRQGKYAKRARHGDGYAAREHSGPEAQARAVPNRRSDGPEALRCWK